MDLKFDANLHAAEIIAANEEARLTASPVLRCITAPLALLDVDGMIYFANDALCELLNLRAQDLHARNLDFLCKQADCEETLTDMLLMQRSLKYINVRLIGAAGKTTHAQISANPVFNSSGALTAFIATVRDMSKQLQLINELKAAKEEIARQTESIDEFKNGIFQLLQDLEATEAKLADTCQKLQEAQNQAAQTSKLSALGELSAALAHELNQPLTVIKGLSQYLLRDANIESLNYEKLKLITEASSKMETVIKHLAVFTRNERPKQQPVDLNAVINEALLIARAMLVNRSIDVIMNLAPVPLIIGCSARLEQIVLNIASNAKDAMQHGGQFRIITREVKRNGSRFAQMSFQDSGGGIPAHALDKIFDPFFTTKEPGKGTGLGLSISCAIVKEHNGEIDLHNDPPHGCTFHISFPAAAQN